jgi:hypothetical protein
MRSLRRPMLLALLLFSVVPAFAKVNSKKDPSADFSTFKTYSWVGGFPATRELTDWFIKATIDHEMQRRGLQMLQDEDKDKADVWIHYDLGIGGVVHIAASDPTYITVGGLPMTYSAIFFDTGSTVGGVMAKGSLAVEMFDRKKRALVWFAATSEGIEKRSKREEQLNRVVGKIFDKYPEKPIK